MLENRINLYLIPKEWIFTNSGLSEIISNILNLQSIDLFQIQIAPSEYKPIGRICSFSVSSVKLKDLLDLIKHKLNLDYVRYFGDLESLIQSLLLIIDQQLTPQILKLARRANINTIICENFTYDDEKLAEELDLNLIATTTAIINLGLLKLSQSLRIEHPDVEFTFIPIQSLSKIF